MNAPTCSILVALFTTQLFSAWHHADAQLMPETPQQHQARMAWWREARFGMFIHWGVYAIPGRGEWYMFNQKVPITEYEKYPARFNPVQFDAREWVRLAKDAGMKYIVITSKHHDGFCMWDSKVSTYDIVDRTPFKRDPLKELAVACREEGIRLCFYYSIMDWHHPDASGARFPLYREEYLKPELKELLTGYGPIGVLWFDGEWIPEWTEEEGQDLYRYVRSLQPAIIVNNRVGKGRNGMAGLSSDPDAAGDFGTPEQEIPPNGIEGADWESCMTMNDNWGYAAADTNWKSTKVLVRNLIDIASKGGNYLLNVGPTALGTIPDQSVLRLKQIGRWMATNGESIYGTIASPLSQTPWGRCTQKKLSSGGTRLYLHLFDWPQDRIVLVTGVGSAPAGARLLGRPGTSLAVNTYGDTVQIALPETPVDSIASVVALDFPGPLVTYHPPSLSAASPIFLTTDRVTMSARSPGMEIRYTIDGTIPDSTSSLYQSPVEVSASATLKARCFHHGKPVSTVSELRVEKVGPERASAVSRSAPGLQYEYFEGVWERVPDFGALQPVSTGVAEAPGLSMRERDENFGLVLTGFVQVPATDIYELGLTSDDGSKLMIDGKVVVDNDGLHGALERTGVIALEEGLHAIRILYFNRTGDRVLSLTVSRQGESPIVAPGYSHQP
jgi:alpha-L-fucosidase